MTYAVGVADRPATNSAAQEFSKAISSAELLGGEVVGDLLGVLGAEGARLVHLTATNAGADLGVEVLRAAIVVMTPSASFDDEQQVEDAHRAALDELHQGRRDPAGELVAGKADDDDVNGADGHACLLGEVWADRLARRPNLPSGAPALHPR